MSNHTGYVVLKNNDEHTYDLVNNAIFETTREAWESIPKNLDGHYRIFRLEPAGARLKLQQTKN